MTRQKITMITILILIIISITIYALYRVSDSKSDKPIPQFKITNEEYNLENDTIYYSATLTNNSTEDMKIKTFDIIFEDSHNKEIAIVTNKISKTLKSNNSILISSQTKINATNEKIANVSYKLTKY